MQGSFEQHYTAVREQNRREQARRQTECAARSGAFLGFADARANAVLDVAAGRSTPAEATETIRRVRCEEHALLLSIGLPPDYLEPVFTCPHCRDTGYIGEDVRTPCSCLLKIRQQALCTASRINAYETFESFDAKLFSDEMEQKRHLNAKKLCERFAGQPADTRPCNLLLTGTAGVGKSFLGNAVAYRAMENGTDSRFLTAYQLIQNALDGISQHIDGVADAMRVPLLVLDDLGVEPMIPNITLETVFSVLNERTATGKKTMILTNLSLSELQAVYGERIASRLYDERNTIVLQLTGANLRRGIS